MNKTQRDAIEAVLRAWDSEEGMPQLPIAIEVLRASLTDAESQEERLDYEIRVDDEWMAGADRIEDAIGYAYGYIEEGVVRVYERRIKEIAVLEARHD